ncbi:hypothetical protein ACWPM1_00240 [Tsuneonella sp. HG249]
MTFIYLAAAAMIITAAIHSLAGERMVVKPLVTADHPVIRAKGRRAIIRPAWHLTSLFMLTNAVVVTWPDAPGGLVGLIGAFWLVVGIFALVSSRGRHVGWPSLTASGVLALLGANL